MTRLIIHINDPKQEKVVEDLLEKVKGIARVITHVRMINKVVILLTMYDSSGKESITEKERDHLIALAEQG